MEEASTFFGACGAIRRHIFLELGGFDETFKEPSIEDIEFGYRLKKAGYRIKLIKSVQVRHLKKWDFRTLIRSDFRYRAVPWTRLILRDHMFINDLNLTVSSRLSVIVLYLLIGTLAGAFFRERLLIMSFVFFSDSFSVKLEFICLFPS